MLKLDSNFERIWIELDGFYTCPRHPTTNERLGPLVGYAGRYKDGDEQKQYVGDGYFNFAVIESDPNPDVLDHFASNIAHRISAKFGSRTVDTFCAMPMGGLLLGSSIAQHLCAQRVFPDKKVIQAATASSREKSQLLFGRHTVRPETKVVIVEDVCNNFSTTEEACRLIKAKGATVIGIACALNRSPAETFESTVFGSLPVISLIFKSMPEYRQDDPEVSGDVSSGNVVWKPKEEWASLLTAVTNAEERLRAIETGS